MFKIIGVDKKEYGPVSPEHIRQWIAEGRANAATLVQAEGSAQWVPLGSLPEFAAALPTRPSLPPPPGASASASAGTPPDPDELAEEIRARDYQVNVGACLGRGWDLVREDFWPAVGGAAVVWIIATTVGLIAWPAYAGLYVFFLKKLRGQRAEFHDVFAGFSIAFLPLFLGGLVAAILSGLGLLLCILPGIYLLIAWSFAMPLMVDKKMDFWPALECSRKIVNKNWWGLFGFFLVNLLFFVLSHLACCVGAFVYMPVMFAAYAALYEEVFHPSAPAPHAR
jgi:hypothetical protein